MSGQSEMQTLKEEIEFLRRVHQQELGELHRSLEEVGRGVDREVWQSEMSQAIRDIQDRYDIQLEKLRTDMDEMYNARVSGTKSLNYELFYRIGRQKYPRFNLAYDLTFCTWWVYFQVIYEAS
ncbi:unnamed protein product [Dibothriocephalus latus]|uniref:IF rod domain-containing protein n=1 Tax=Dibothriocephalus latus TaxID=60516 RepID=A0A3P6SHZ0_DIBLA|nr:unnamed protein product [Dibothriocephalus latus]